MGDEKIDTIWTEVPWNVTPLPENGEDIVIVDQTWGIKHISVSEGAIIDTNGYQLHMIGPSTILGWTTRGAYEEHLLHPLYTQRNASRG